MARGLRMWEPGREEGMGRGEEGGRERVALQEKVPFVAGTPLSNEKKKSRQNPPRGNDLRLGETATLPRTPTSALPLICQSMSAVQAVAGGQEGVNLFNEKGG